MGITIQIANPELINKFETLPDGVLASVINDKKSIIESSDLIIIALSTAVAVPASILANWIYDKFKKNEPEVKVFIYDRSVNSSFTIDPLI